MVVRTALVLTWAILAMSCASSSMKPTLPVKCEPEIRAVFVTARARCIPMCAPFDVLYALETWNGQRWCKCTNGETTFGEMPELDE